MLQTTIDINVKRGKNIKLVITNVKKAFDQVWRAGVFSKLGERNIQGNILRLIIEINQNLIARIKGDEESYSQNFTWRNPLDREVDHPQYCMQNTQQK